MTPICLLDRCYSGETIVDINEHVDDALANCTVPEDEHGFQRGSFRVTVTWVEDEQAQPIPLCDNEALLEQASSMVAEALGDSAYDCTRAWEAWRVNTMREDDFEPIAESSERTTEIAKAALKALHMVPLPHIAEVWHEGSSSFYRAQLLSKLDPEDVDYIAPMIETTQTSRRTDWVYNASADEVHHPHDFFTATANATDIFYRGTRK